MTFRVLKDCCLNKGQAYSINAIIGDCFCPDCKKPVLMLEPLSGDYFHGQCSCRRYVEARIILDKNAKAGKWEVLE